VSWTTDTNVNHISRQDNETHHTGKGKDRTKDVKKPELVGFTAPVALCKTRPDNDSDSDNEQGKQGIRDKG
jgi:hypothetical protein